MNIIGRYETRGVGSEFNLRNGNNIMACQEVGYTQFWETTVLKREEVSSRVEIKVSQYGWMDIL